MPLIDIHCHILPSLDDGAQSLEETISMAETAVRHGIHTVIATPHHANGRYENESGTIANAVYRITQELVNRNIPLNLLPGQEIRVTDRLLDELQEGKLATLNNSRYILLEFPHTHIPERTDQLLYELRVRQLIPVIAHPERNAEIIRSPRQVARLTQQGALLQLTADSLIGRFGLPIQKLSMQLCKDGLVAFLASDAHNATRSVHHLSLGYSAMEQWFGSDAAEFYKHNAFCLTENMDVSEWELPSVSKKQWYAFWR